MKLIDKDALVAEIERLQCPEHGYCLDTLLDFLDTIEVKDVNLQKEIDKEWKKCNPIDEGMGVESAFIHIEAFDMIARHFFELGLKAKKEEVK